MATKEQPDHSLLEDFLAQVRTLMGVSLSETTLQQLVKDSEGLLGSGKMLRTRILFRVGRSLGVAEQTLIHAAAAVEMVHAASLLHDDVIDGGYLRRHHPTFWVEHGVSGAILLGDLLLFKAMELTTRVAEGCLTRPLILMTGEVCETEAEQELIYRGKAADWDTCLHIARGKTGALFAFSALAAGGRDLPLSEKLREAGYLAGTAYQLADDILDATGTLHLAGKTLGTDAGREKTTALRVRDDEQQDPVAAIEQLLINSCQQLSPWPEALAAWQGYLDLDLHPAIRKLTDTFRNQNTGS